MMMRRALKGMTAVVVLLPTSLCAAEYTFSGTTKVDGTPTYTETHALRGECGERFRPQQHEVVYRSTSKDAVIGTKALNYAESALRPSFDFRQTPFDERMQLTNSDDRQARIEWRTPHGDTETFTVGINDDVVIDSGFVHFIQANWRSLTSGERVGFRFMAPTRGEHYAFVAEPTTNSRVAAHLTVTIRPSGVILQWLVDPIILGFDRRGRLTDYLGLTNIRRSEDGNYVAHIRYEATKPPCPLISDRFG